MFGRSKAAFREDLEDQVNASFNPSMAISHALLSPKVVRFRVGDLVVRGSELKASVECSDDRTVSADTASYIAESLRDCVGDRYEIDIVVRMTPVTVSSWTFMFLVPIWTQRIRYEQKSFESVGKFRSWLRRRNPHETTIDNWCVTLTRR